MASDKYPLTFPLHFWLIVAEAWAIVSSLLSGIALPQGNCPGGVCPLRQSQSQADPAIVRIGTRDRDGGYSLCSGTLIDVSGGDGLIVTCFHEFRTQASGAKTTVTFPGGGDYDAKLVATDPANDLAALRIAAPKGAIPRLLAVDRPARGAATFICGYGPARSFRALTGCVDGYAYNRVNGPADCLVVTGRARDGDSGGPILNANGEVAAIVSASDGNTYGTCCHVIRGFLDRLRSRLGRGKSQGPNTGQPAIDGGQNVPPADPPIVAGPVDDVGSGRGNLLSAEREKIRALENKLESGLGSLAAHDGAINQLKTDFAGIQSDLASGAPLAGLESKVEALAANHGALAGEVGKLRGMVDAIPAPIKEGVLHVAEAAAPGILSTLGLASGPAGLAVSLALALMHRGLSKKIDGLAQQRGLNPGGAAVQAAAFRAASANDQFASRGPIYAAGANY